MLANTRLRKLYAFVIAFLVVSADFRLSDGVHRHQRSYRGNPPGRGRFILSEREAALAKETVVDENGNKELKCNMTFRRGQRARWVHNGMRIDIRHFQRFQMNEQGDLLIANAMKDDSGLWYCQLENGVTSLVTYNLVVREVPREVYFQMDDRRLDASNSFIPIKERENISLECVVEGGWPPPHLEWTLTPGRAIQQAIATNKLQPPKFQLVKVHETGMEGVIVSTMLLPNVSRLHHNATIGCYVVHPALKKPLNSTVILDVEYPPTFAIDRKPGFGSPLEQGIPVSLSCNIDANPEVTPLWQRIYVTGVGVPTGEQMRGFLNFSAIRLDEGGWYRCRTVYMAKEFTSISYYLNVINGTDISYDEEMEFAEDGEPASVEVMLGGELQLECPQGEVSCWARSRRFESLGPGPGLKLENVIYQEAGQYKCFVSKLSRMNHWKARTMNITVVGAPVVHPRNKTVSAVSETIVTLTVEVCSNPPPTHHFWINKNLVLYPGYSHGQLMAHKLIPSLTPHCQKSELTVNSVQVQKHSGEYTFVAISPMGTASSIFTLNLTEATFMDKLEMMWQDTKRKVKLALRELTKEIAMEPSDGNTIGQSKYLTMVSLACAFYAAK